MFHSEYNEYMVSSRESQMRRANTQSAETTPAALARDTTSVRSLKVYSSRLQA
jgi:hypothetical protein